MSNLIKIELYKLNKGKSRFILLFSFSFMFFLSLIMLKFSSKAKFDRNFISNIQCFFDINYDLILPISVGSFVISSICNEYKNKSIKNLLMSQYSRSQIILSKFFALSIYTSIVYILTITAYTVLSYILSDRSNIYFNYKIATRSEIIMNIIECNILALLFILAIISFAMILGLIFKKQLPAIVSYIIIMTIISIVFVALDSKAMVFPQYTFMTLSSISYLGVPGYTYAKIQSIIPIFSNIFLFLAISMKVLDKYQY